MESFQVFSDGTEDFAFWDTYGSVSYTHLQRAMKEADVLIMNSTFEGIPMTILEAISQGLPVITTDVGGIKEVLTYGKDSEVTDGSVERIHTAMDKILLDYEAYAKAAYDKSLQFDYRKVNRKVFDAVSYTHLDVYKRQAYTAGKKRKGGLFGELHTSCKRGGPGQEGVEGAARRIQGQRNPVS